MFDPSKTMAVAMAMAALLTGCDGRRPAVAAPPVAAPQDPGGLSFDFKALSDQRFGGASGGVDVAKGVKPHPNYGFVYNSSWLDSSAGIPAAAVKQHVTWSEEGDEFVVVNGEGLLAVCRNDADVAAYVLSSWGTDIPLPDGEGGMYRLAFDYKMSHTIGQLGQCIVRANAKGGFTVKEGLENCDSEWKPFVAQFSVAKGERTVRVNLNLSGVGSLRYRGLSLVRETIATRVQVTTGAHGQVDKSFAVGAGQVGCITYMWRRRFGEPEFATKDFSFRLTLPKGFTFRAANWVKKGAAKVTVRPDGASEVLLPAKAGRGPTYSYRDSNWSRFGILVQAAADAREGMGSFEVLYRGETVSNVEPTRWFAIPAVKVAAKPKRYRNGFFPGSGYGVYDDPEASFAYAKMASDAGADWWIPSVPPKPALAALYRKAGIALITPQTGGVRDGYVVHGGSYASAPDIPESERYQARQPGSNSMFATAVCPLSVVDERPFFMTNTVPSLRAKLAGMDGVWANWEPFSFVNQGCMCERCRKAFAQHLGIPEAQLTHDLWWQEAKDGGKYAAENRRFRSLVHARLVKTVDRHVRAMTGGEQSTGLIPGISWCEMSSFWRPNDYPKETKAIDYAGSLEWMDPWGPYPFWNLDGVFARQEGFNVAYWFAAKDVREQVDRDYTPPNRPKLMAFPQGAMACEWITEPEWMGLGLDSFFFNGWEASVVYFFPKGYDARYWRSFAEATERAAKYEDFVFDGRRCDGEVSLRTPGFSQICKGKVVAPYLPHADVSLVQHAAYEKGGRLIVAVLNFSDTQAAQVELAHPAFGAQKGEVPPARCRVFELERRRN